MIVQDVLSFLSFWQGIVDQCHMYIDFCLLLSRISYMQTEVESIMSVVNQEISEKTDFACSRLLYQLLFEIILEDLSRVSLWIEISNELCVNLSKYIR